MFALWLWDVFISTLRCFHFDSEMFSLRLELRRFHFDNQVTASTVGYGDICVRTSLGKLAVALLLLLLTITYYYLLTLTKSTFFTSFSILIITFNQHWSLLLSHDGWVITLLFISTNAIGSIVFQRLSSWAINYFESLPFIKVILYLLVAIASFANYLPEIAELLGNRPKYGGSYKVIKMRRIMMMMIYIYYDEVCVCLFVTFWQPPQIWQLLQGD